MNGPVMVKEDLQLTTLDEINERANIRNNFNKTSISMQPK